MRAAVIAFLTLLAASCGSGSVSTTGDDTGLDGLSLTMVAPGTLVPGSRIVLAGHSFVDSPYGDSRLRLRGTLDGAPVDVSLPATFVGYAEMRVDWGGAEDAGLPASEGIFSGDAILEVQSTIDGGLHESPPFAVSLTVRDQLEPRVDVLQTGVIFVNDPIIVEGDGFLLGGDEGTTVAIVEGCFLEDGAGGSCTPVGPYTVDGTPETAFDRTRLTFPFAPEIAGIRPGHFDGTVTIQNRHGAAAGNVMLPSPAEVASYDMVPPLIFSFSPTTVSLGQYVDVDGGGFVGLPPDAPNQLTMLTLVEFTGSFTPEGGSPVAVTLTLIPQYENGRRCRYVVNEEDELGQRVDLRTIAGSFSGTVRPVIKLGTDEVTGDPTQVTLAIGHVKQVVYINFQPSYVESLRHFGLRGVDAKIRERVLEVARRDYAGVNVEFRAEPPTDFAYFAQVDLSGPDPNGIGLLGYDNSPGKDVGNRRLYDKIGGVNATTQEDGYPGYGGVFVESLFGFSMHPGGFAMPLEGGQDPVFDEIFDPFRPDRDGHPVLAADLAAGIPELTDGAGCPAASGDRQGQIGCAIWVLGSMVGTTMTHEVGHSLGLANPMEEMAFHDVGDQPNRLMDAGGARTFYERSELMGEGPARFCDMEYDYLRQILPSGEPAPAVTRPTCF